MKQKAKKKQDNLFTFTQFKEKFFPGEDFQKEDEHDLTRESFFDLLEKVSRPTKQSVAPVQPAQER